MQLVESLVLVESGDGSKIDGEHIINQIDKVARKAYSKANKFIVNNAKQNFLYAKENINELMLNGHEDILEHFLISVTFVCNLYVTKELMKYRVPLYSQENNNSFIIYNDDIVFIIPPWFKTTPIGSYKLEKGELICSKDLDLSKWDFNEGQWIRAMILAENTYKNLIAKNWSVEQAISVLPNSLKTDTIISCDIKKWRDIIKAGISKQANPHVQYLMLILLKNLKDNIPLLFDDL